MLYMAVGNGKLSETQPEAEPDDAAGSAVDGDAAEQHGIKAEHAPHDEPSAPDTLAQGTPRRVRELAASSECLDTGEITFFHSSVPSMLSSQLPFSFLSGGQPLPAQQEEVRWHGEHAAMKAEQPADGWQTGHAQQVQCYIRGELVR